jgi:hypothetical protein
MTNLPVPYPAPSAVTSITMTSAFWNANVRDAINFLSGPPQFSGYQTTANTGIASGTWTKITIDTVVVDSYGYWDNTNHRYTPSTPGWYWVSGMACWASSATGGRFSQAFKNGSQVIQCKGYTTGAAINGHGGSMSGWVYLNGAGDYVELYGWQNSGAALNGYADSSTASQFNIDWRHF